MVTEAIEYLALPNRLLDVGEVRPPADVAEAFGRRNYRHAEPSATDLTSPGKIRGGAVNLLKQLGYNSVEFIDPVSVRLPTTQEFEVLELPDDIPFTGRSAPTTPLTGCSSR